MSVLTGVRIKRVEFRENVRAFPRDKAKKLSVITRWSNLEKMFGLSSGTKQKNWP